jgi:hypothetical protein
VIAGAGDREVAKAVSGHNCRIADSPGQDRSVPAATQSSSTGGHRQRLPPLRRARRSNDSIVVTRTGAATGRVTRDRPLLESGQAICNDPALISVVHVHDRLAEERSVELDEVDRLAASEHGLAVLDREDDLHAE